MCSVFMSISQDGIKDLRSDFSLINCSYLETSQQFSELHLTGCLTERPTCV